MKKKDINDSLNNKDDETGGDSSGGGSGFVPSYYDLLGADVDEIELAGLSAKALQENRIKVKAKGISVTALDKPQEARNNLNAEINANPGDGAGGGLGLEQHPELAETGGDVDPNTIVLPKSEQEALASNDMDLKLQLLAEYKKKMDMKMGIRPAPEPTPAPRMRPSAPPRPRPTGFR